MFCDGCHVIIHFFSSAQDRCDFLRNALIDPLHYWVHIQEAWDQQYEMLSRGEYLGYTGLSENYVTRTKVLF
jgi:hypothetical protein